MARYIDADALLEELRSLQVTLTGIRVGKNYLSTIVREYQKSVLKIVHEQPTADVVPESEVEYQKRKQEVMLLDAIDTFRNLLCIDSYVDYEDTRKHYAVSIDDVNRIHAELKKKYTEGKDE